MASICRFPTYGGEKVKIAMLKCLRASAAAACAAILVIMVVMSGTAHAEERHFCWGFNAPSGGGCETATQWMQAAYTNSSEGAVCLLIGGQAACDHSPNEGVYISVGCTYTRAAIYNPTGHTETVYGVFWSC